MCQIAELKDCFHEGDDEITDALENQKLPQYEGPQLLYGCHRRVSKAQVLDAVPARSVTDRLLADFFAVGDLATSTAGYRLCSLRANDDSRLSRSNVSPRGS